MPQLYLYSDTVPTFVLAQYRFGIIILGRRKQSHWCISFKYYGLPIKKVLTCNFSTFKIRLINNKDLI